MAGTKLHFIDTCPLSDTRPDFVATDKAGTEKIAGHQRHGLACCIGNHQRSHKERIVNTNIISVKMENISIIQNIGEVLSTGL